MPKVLHRDLVGIASSLTLSQLGASLITVFVPLLLLQKGLALWQVCAFYAAYAIVKLIINYPAVAIIGRRGVRTGLTLGYIASGTYLVALTLFLAGRGGWLLYVLPVFLAAYHAFAWASQHLHISHNMDETRTGRDLSVIMSLWQLAGIVAPLVGAGIALWLGQAWLAAVAALCVLAAIIPIRRATASGHDVTQKVRYSFKGAPAGDLWANFALCAQGMVGLGVWPIYLAVMLPNLKSIAFITTGSAALAFVLVLIAGKRGDQGQNRRILIESNVLVSLAHIGRLFASTPLGITLVSAASNLGQSYQAIPWSSLYYKHARRAGINYIMSMEIACDLALITVWSSLTVAAYFLAGNTFFTIAFVAAAIVSWGCLFIKNETKNRPQTESPPAVPAGPTA